MTPQRFQQIESLYQAICEGTAEERAALLEQTDPDLRRELESLLAQRSGGELLERAALQSASPEVTEDVTLTEATAGASFGPYRIEGKLGEGGMGEVFRAIDTRLGRAVAIKVSREQFSTRFEREARAISALNHPHICTLYDVGPNYLVMELVEGETIAARLKNGPLPVAVALQYALQIAAALGEAHQKGIVHRDLKPGNIMIAKSGVKVLDFGLAKSEADDNTATASRMIVGTPAYMAPEQREGRPVDTRTDIYSFGCVLYEMLTGARPGAHRKRMPSRRLEKIVRQCLDPDPKCRWQTAGELAQELGRVNTLRSPWKLAALVAAGLAAVYVLYVRTAPKLTGKDTIVLADFDNKTGDPVFDDTLRQALAVELEQSPVLSLLSERTVQQMLSLMRESKGARVTRETAQQICERTASAAILEGSIAPLGSQFVLSLRAKTCKSGNLLYQGQALAAKREEILNAVSRVAREFRTTVGESLAAVEQHSTPLEEASTSSLEALKEYSTGMRVHFTAAGNAAGIPFFRRAVEIDPQFAMAYANLGLSYSSLGQSLLSAEMSEKAWRLRDRVSNRERFFIEFLYYRDVTGNLEKAYQTLESWMQVYPHAASPPSPQDLMVGISTNGTGRFERAIQMGEKEVADHPDNPFGYGGLAGSYFYTGRFSEAESVLQRASERRLGNPAHLMVRYNVAVLKGDQEQMNRIEALAKGRREAEHRLAHAKALALARSGHLGAARVQSDRAVALALHQGDDEVSASYQAARAVWEAMCGNVAEGKTTALHALEHSKAREVQYAAGLALAFAGDYSRSEALAGDLEKRLPEDTLVKFTYVPVLHALAALGRSKPEEAMERLQATLPYELAVNGLNFSHYYLGGLHSAYLRGQALTAEHRHGEAITELQKIFNHPGLVGTDPIGGLAHVQLGRVYSQSGENAKAKDEYQAFFTMWQNADTGIPVLEKAKAEYAKLH